MAVTQVRTCDICSSNKNVQILTGVYGKRPFEVDLCADCWDTTRAPFDRSIRRPTRSTIKPQHRFHKTDLAKTNL